MALNRANTVWLRQWRDMMNRTQLQSALSHLIDTYVDDDALGASLLRLLERDPVPAKGILAELSPHIHHITPADSMLLQDIVHYYV